MVLDLDAPGGGPVRGAAADLRHADRRLGAVGIAVQAVVVGIAEQVAPAGRGAVVAPGPVAGPPGDQEVARLAGRNPDHRRIRIVGVARHEAGERIGSDGAGVDVGRRDGDRPRQVVGRGRIGEGAGILGRRFELAARGMQRDQRVVVGGDLVERVVRGPAGRGRDVVALGERQPQDLGRLRPVGHAVRRVGCRRGGERAHDGIGLERRVRLGDAVGEGGADR